ncbi:unnamed protein product [Parnassius apollo]|uniref:(apollo) hypothetical protein n=1 Tax=Parnassius apollo TaxID=110799 RepID=A0A8S3XHZ5_PARAO|nr:unnamed protein product [Parnassius apollo]
MLMPSFEDFVQIDDDVTSAGEQTDDDIVKNCMNTCIARNDSEDEAQIPETEIKIIPIKLALNALESVHQYFTLNMRRFLIKQYSTKFMS